MKLLSWANSLRKQKGSNHQRESIDFADLTEEEEDIINLVSDYTMTSVERQISLCRIMDYVLSQQIPGDFVECGVWRGGSSMIAAYKLAKYGSDKKLWLYDTFEGMPDPDDTNDISHDNKSAKSIMNSQKDIKHESLIWAIGSLEEVKSNLIRTGYGPEKVEYIKGKVEDTIPHQKVPNVISVLRLDTDWYSSVFHGLVHLYPLVSNGGFIIIDDYGHWQGAKKAVDQYIETIHPVPYLNRVDYTCRVIQKFA